MGIKLFMIGMYLSNYFGSRKIMFFSGIMISLCIFIASLVESIEVFAIFYAIAGFFNGILYMFPIAIGMKYFEDNKGLVTGLFMGFYGISSVIL